MGLGVEKVAISAALVENPQLATGIARELGAQSVVAVLDVRKKGRFGSKYDVWTHNGTRNSKKTAPDLAREFEQAGVGEVVVNGIAQDGMMNGYDMTVLEQVRDATSVPLTALGGAGSLDDIANVFERLGVVGAAAGSLFVFKGAYKAVLINYPGESERKALYAG